MNSLHIRLFGKFDVRQDDQIQTSRWTRRGQELLCYLVLHRSKAHPREALIDALWSNCPPTQSRKQLRQALWQVQSAFNAICSQAVALLSIEPEWIGFNPDANVWIDVVEFDQACRRLQHQPGGMLDHKGVQALNHLVDLYRGDLLEGWYKDWCVFERERLQNLYLGILDRLLEHCELCGEYRLGLDCGDRILRIDRAHERTHQRLIRLHYHAGNRSAALRQYECCATALREELDVKPSRQSQILYEQIRADTLDDIGPQLTMATPPIAAHDVLDQLKQIQATLITVQTQLHQDLLALEQLFSSRR